MPQVADGADSVEFDVIGELQNQFGESEIVFDDAEKKKTGRAGELAVWRSLFSSLLDLGFKKACISILQFLQQRHGISSMVIM